MRKGVLAVEPGDPAVPLPDVDGAPVHQHFGRVIGLLVAAAFGLVDIDDMTGLADHVQTIE